MTRSVIARLSGNVVKADRLESAKNHVLEDVGESPNQLLERVLDSVVARASFPGSNAICLIFDAFVGHLNVITHFPGTRVVAFEYAGAAPKRVLLKYGVPSFDFGVAFETDDQGLASNDRFGIWLDGL